MTTNTKVANSTPPRAGKLPFPLSPSEGWSTVIIAAIPVLITVGAIESFAWTGGTEILTSTTIVGMLLGFTLAKQQLVPQWLADIPGLGIGILFALFQTASVTDGGNVADIAGRLGGWLRGAAAGQGSTDDAIFLLFLGVLTMLLGYVSMWLIFRSRSPWLAVIANAVVLLINLNYGGDDKFVFAVMFMITALLLLLRFNLVEQMRIWRRKGLRYSPEIGWDFMQAGLIFTVIILLLGVALPSGAVSRSLEGLWNGPSSPWSNIQGNFTRLFKVNATGGKTRVGFGDSLSIQGSVNLPDTIVMTYVTTDTTGALLQGRTLDSFDGHTWVSKGGETQKLDAGAAVTPETQVYTNISQTIHIINAPDGVYIYAAGEGGSFSVPITLHSDGIGLTTDDDIGSFTAWEATPPLKSNQTYQAQSFLSAATEDQLRGVPMPKAPGQLGYSANLLTRYTQLPDDLKNNPDNSVLATALDWTQNATTMFDKVEAIVDHFHTDGFQYSAQNPEIPGNTDAASYLLQRKQGFCTWYATGFIMMARSLGIPARFVDGFTNGTFDSKTQQWVINGTNAHAWAQVYFPGYGWVNFEPSVSFSEFARPTTPAGGTDDNNVPPPPTKTTAPVKKPPVKDDTPDSSTTANGHPTQPINPVVAAVTISVSTLLALALLLALGLAVWWRLIFRGLSPVASAFGRMALLGRFAGIKPRRSQTASEYGGILAQRLPDQAGAINEITDLYVQERWAPTETEPPATIGEQWRAVRDSLVQRISRQRPSFRLRMRRRI